MARILRFGVWAILATWCGHVLAAQDDDRSLTAGDVFPDFALEHSDGTIWRMTDHAGQPKVVLFWATWCPYCRKLFPGIVDLDRQYGSEGLEIVAVNFRDDEDTDAYARRHGLEFDIVLSGDALAQSIGVRGTPTVFVLDSNNLVQLRSSDSNPENPVLRRAVAEVMAETATAQESLAE